MSHTSDNNTTYSDPSTIEEFYQTDFYSEDGDISVKQTKREREAFVDSGKHVIYRKRRAQDGSMKQYRIVVYSTPSGPGRRIRHAITGNYGDYRVGYANEEDMYFSVILASGEVGQTPAILFYDTPEQYESHFGTQLPDAAKHRWLAKFNAARRELESFDQKTNTFSNKMDVVETIEVK